MKKSITKFLLPMIVLGLAIVSCTNKNTGKNNPSDEPSASKDNSALVVAADNNLKAHQEDIVALWDLTLGEDEEIAKYALAKDYVFLATEDGDKGLLLSFYKDMKDIDNFDGIEVKDGQELAFQGDIIVVKEKSDEGDKTTYYEKTEREGFNQLFTVTEKDGKKTYTNDVNEPYDEKEALDFLVKIKETAVSSLASTLSSWNDI